MSEVVHVLQQELQTYLTKLFPNESDSLTEGHLSNCNSCVARLTEWDEFFETLREMPPVRPDGKREQRRNPRFATDGSGVLQILNPFSVEFSAVRITDVSKDGMRIHIATPVQRGSFVKVRMKTSLFFGKSRYCEPAPDGFFYVGIHLHDFFAPLPLGVKSHQ
jgi:hypothetical protein